MTCPIVSILTRSPILFYTKVQGQAADAIPASHLLLAQAGLEIFDII